MHRNASCQDDIELSSIYTEKGTGEDDSELKDAGETDEVPFLKTLRKFAQFGSVGSLRSSCRNATSYFSLFPALSAGLFSLVSIASLLPFMRFGSLQKANEVCTENFQRFAAELELDLNQDYYEDGVIGFYLRCVECEDDGTIKEGGARG